jgi:hypothetical protein
MVHIQNDSIILLWHDMWENRVINVQSVELYSYTTTQHVSKEQTIIMENLHNIFHLPMSEIAFQQFLVLNFEIDGLTLN